MKYVLDASVALKWVLDEPNVERARMLREEFESFVTELIAPDHFAVEVAHVLGTARYKGKLTIEQADAYLEDLMTSPPIFVSSRLLLPRAFKIAQGTKTGVYDALYLALGEAERIPVVTADKEMANKKEFHVILIQDLPLPPTDDVRLPR
jgi:predicted nucleic acid-binding protein